LILLNGKILCLWRRKELSRKQISEEVWNFALTLIGTIKESLKKWWTTHGLDEDPRYMDYMYWPPLFMMSINQIRLVWIQKAWALIYCGCSLIRYSVDIPFWQDYTTATLPVLPFGGNFSQTTQTWPHKNFSCLKKSTAEFFSKLLINGRKCAELFLKSVPHNKKPRYFIEKCSIYDLIESIPTISYQERQYCIFIFSVRKCSVRATIYLLADEFFGWSGRKHLPGVGNHEHYQDRSGHF
jgi:hypothetical protein